MTTDLHWDALPLWKERQLKAALADEALVPRKTVVRNLKDAKRVAQWLRHNPTGTRNTNKRLARYWGHCDE